MPAQAVQPLLGKMPVGCAQPFLLNSFLNMPLGLPVEVEEVSPLCDSLLVSFSVFMAHWLCMVAKTSYNGKNSTGAST